MAYFCSLCNILDSDIKCIHLFIIQIMYISQYFPTKAKMSKPFTDFEECINSLIFNLSSVNNFQKISETI